MKHIIKDIIGILVSTATLWIASVLLIPPVLAAWPHGEGSVTIPLMPQNIPGLFIGFILSLYVFRRITKVSPERKDSDVRHTGITKE